MFSRIVCMGRLTRDPEVVYTAAGLAVTGVTIVMNEKVKGEDNAIYLDVTFFGKTAEAVGQHFHKGDPILAEGRLSQDRWEKNGEKRDKIKMIASGFSFIPRTRDRADHTPSAAEDSHADPVMPDDPVWLPF